MTPGSSNNVRDKSLMTKTIEMREHRLLMTAGPSNKVRDKSLMIKTIEMEDIGYK